LEDSREQPTDYGRIVDNHDTDGISLFRHRRLTKVRVCGSSAEKGQMRPTWENFVWMISLSKGFMMYSFAPAASASWMCWRSFSVVQNTTATRSPPGSARSSLRNSMPSMTGMFQSSNTPSGSLDLQ